MPCGSVFDPFCVEALKMGENHEKQCFTFFAFLPPYIRVSGSLVWHAQEHEEIYRLVSKILNFMPCGSVFDRLYVGGLNMAENHEKPRFTFFAFLPPYLGVSGSLVSRKRKSVKRSIDWYQKFLISCPAARYSVVFVFSGRISMKIYENLLKIY